MDCPWSRRTCGQPVPTSRTSPASPQCCPSRHPAPNFWKSPTFASSWSTSNPKYPFASTPNIAEFPLRYKATSRVETAGVQELAPSLATRRYRLEPKGRAIMKQIWGSSVATIAEGTHHYRTATLHVDVLAVCPNRFSPSHLRAFFQLQSRSDLSLPGIAYIGDEDNWRGTYSNIKILNWNIF